MINTIDELVKEGKIPADSAERMKKKRITTVNELYCLINSVTAKEDDELNMKLAEELQVHQVESEDPREKLKNYMNDLKPYVSEEVLNQKPGEDYPLSCSIAQELIRGLKPTDSQMPKQAQSWQETEMEKFYRTHPEYRRD